MREVSPEDWSWVNATADRFERDWKRGPRPRIEDYLSEVSESRRGRLLDELLRVESEIRSRGGEKPTAAEYCLRFPEHAAVIDDVFGEEASSDPADSSVAMTAASERDRPSWDRFPAPSILARLAQATGPIPRVLLRDTQTELRAAVAQASFSEMAVDTGRYQFLGEIARGGMGTVLKGRDHDLGRDLAIKVLLPEYQDDPEVVRRFVEEAQIGGQLQHPGIVPVYELGQFADRRPFFTMKLVEGSTLAVLFRSRATPAEDLQRFLGIFEQVCHTMAYAHARGVIHRDLKPSNVMVGSFGEVQVMDWGLAKVLPQGGTDDEPRHGIDASPMGIVRTTCDSNADGSQAGSVLGTPAYMAPEQAGGETVDERADVFGLGSILCEILTGGPAYTGESSEVVFSKALRGDTAEALRRLDGSEADAELVALARECLVAESRQRLRSAGEVARRLTAYLAGVQERLKAAELAHAAELARAQEAQATAVAAQGRALAERRVRRMSVTLCTSLVIVGALGVGGWRWVELDRGTRTAAMSARVYAALQDATRLSGLAQGAASGNLAYWIEALAAAEKARDLLDPGAGPALRTQTETVLEAIQAQKLAADAADRTAQSDRRLLDRLADIRSVWSDDTDGSIGDSDYTEAFREVGIDVSAMPPTDLADQINRRTRPTAVLLAAALDDWAALRRTRRNDTAGANRLTEVARKVDPDPWRNQLRNLLEGPGSQQLAPAFRRLAESAPLDNLPAISLDLLGKALLDAGDLKTAETVLRRGQRRFPGDGWLSYDLARCLEASARRHEAIRYYTAARAIRPETAHRLAHNLEAVGEADEAIVVFEDLVRLRPDDGGHWACYGHLLRERGDFRGSQVALQKAVEILNQRIRLKPGDAPTHLNLGNALLRQGKLDDAIAEFRQAARLKPDYAMAHNNLGFALCEQGKLEEAIAESREAIRLDPNYVAAHRNLGNALRALGKLEEAIAAYRAAIRLKPDDAPVHEYLGNALRAQGKLNEAILEFQEASRIQPNVAEYHFNRGVTLGAQGESDEAIAALREAIRLNPRFVESFMNLGAILCNNKQDYDGAIAAFRAVLRINPDLALAQSNLGVALTARGNLDEAIAAYREAIRLRPDVAMSRDRLGKALQAHGKLEEAIAEFHEAIRLKPDLADAHYDLGIALLSRGDREAAITAFREAIRIRPDYAEAHCNLGQLLKMQGRLDQALPEIERGHALGSNRAGWHYPSAEWMRLAQRQVQLKGRLPALLQGKDRPANPDEVLALADLCYTQQLHGASARFWLEVFQAQPALAEDMQVQHRYSAACAAALAGSGQGKDEPALDDATKSRWRNQAREWLRSDLAAWSNILAGGSSQSRQSVRGALEQWRIDVDLTGIRDETAMVKLSVDEQKACRALWSEVDALLAKARSHPSPGSRPAGRPSP